MSYLDWVKLDFVLAVTLTVVCPLLLLFASITIREKYLLNRLLAYWRISALLAISVYLLMAEISMGFLTGVITRILIPPVLWLGDGLMLSSQDLSKSDTKLYRVFAWWRMVVSIYCVSGVIFTLPLVPCGWTGYVTERCAAWFIPPQIYGSLLHDYEMWQTLGEYATFALIIYVSYLLYAIFRSVTLRMR